MNPPGSFMNPIHGPGNFGMINIKTEIDHHHHHQQQHNGGAKTSDGHGAGTSGSSYSDNYVRQLEENLKLTLAEKENLSREIIEVNSRLSQFSHELTVERDTVRKLQLDNTKLKMNSDARAKEMSMSYERNLSIYKRLAKSLENEVKELKAKLARLGDHQQSSGSSAVTSTIEKSATNRVVPEDSEDTDEIEILETSSCINEPRIGKTSVNSSPFMVSIPSASFSPVSSINDQFWQNDSNVNLRNLLQLNSHANPHFPTSRNSLDRVNMSASHMGNSFSSVLSSLDRSFPRSSNEFNQDESESDVEGHSSVAGYVDDKTDADYRMGEDGRKRRKRRSSYQKKYKYVTNKEKSGKKISTVELEMMIRDFPTIPLSRAKGLLQLEKPEKSSQTRHVPFQVVEQKNMLRLVVAYGHYGYAYRKYFWTEHMELFPNRIETTVVQHWRNTIVDKPEYTRSLLVKIGFDETTARAILQMILKIGIVEGDNTELSVPIVRQEEITELTRFMITMEEELKRTLV